MTETTSRPGAPAEHLSLEEASALAPAVTPQEAAARVTEGAFLLDVRSEAGRSRTGAIPGATVGDRYAIDDEFDLTAATHHAPVVSLDTPIVVVCGSVRGSGPVAAELRAKGFTNVAHVEGGFGAWKDAGLPAEEPTTR
ncbi:rhodanese-like domain-containing protein [Cellulomonas sp. URHE0023]|uniref:rhodanese-like domain-containing protein n=1 Tax=Cellulomonas sp. URHE0023 TaxID=1380354 RepID=UPI00048383D4|nr:rhodanese-like domain-containing protein [Cellulomonas sp. URHE0023]